MPLLDPRPATQSPPAGNPLRPFPGRPRWPAGIGSMGCWSLPSACH